MTLVCGMCGARFRVAFAPAAGEPCPWCGRRASADRATVMGAMPADILERERGQQRSEAA